jgi:hypothetical protein
MKFILLVLMFISAEARAVVPFETDYCTNYPEGTRSQPELWKHCCLIHDLFFWSGGSKSDRDEADLDLKSCITDAGAPEQAIIMYLAVRAGSYSPVKYPKGKWGNGWPDREQYLSLSEQETKLIESEINSGYSAISQEIKDYLTHHLNSRLDSK